MPITITTTATVATYDEVRAQVRDGFSTSSVIGLQLIAHFSRLAAGEAKARGDSLVRRERLLIARAYFSQARENTMAGICMFGHRFEGQVCASCGVRQS